MLLKLRRKCRIALCRKAAELAKSACNSFSYRDLAIKEQFLFPTESWLLACTFIPGLIPGVTSCKKKCSSLTTRPQKCG